MNAINITPPKHISSLLPALFAKWLADDVISKSMPDDVRCYFKEVVANHA